MNHVSLKYLYRCVVSLVFCTASIGAHASWLHCKLNAADCIPIQGTLIPFDEAEGILDNCRALTRNNIGAVAMSMSMAKVMDVANEDPSHPLLRAQLAYMALFDSPLKFDRSIPINQRYPYVRMACGQVFSAMNR